MPMSLDIKLTIMTFTSKRSLQDSSWLRSFSANPETFLFFESVNVSGRPEFPKVTLALSAQNYQENKPWGSWTKWIAEKLKDSTLCFFLCFWTDKEVFFTMFQGKVKIWTSKENAYASFFDVSFSVKVQKHRHLQGLKFSLEPFLPFPSPFSHFLANEQLLLRFPWGLLQNNKPDQQTNKHAGKQCVSLSVLFQRKRELYLVLTVTLLIIGLFIRSKKELQGTNENLQREGCCCIRGKIFFSVKPGFRMAGRALCHITLPLSPWRSKLWK